MWAEALLEMFTTALVGYFMVLMGLVSRESATRVIYLATLIFLGPDCWAFPMTPI